MDGSLYIEFGNGDTKRQLPLRTSKIALKLLNTQMKLLNNSRQIQRGAKVLTDSGGGDSREVLVGGSDYALMGLNEGEMFDPTRYAASGKDPCIVVYYYQKAQTTHSSFPDGLEIYEFPNDQVFYCLVYI